MARIVKLNCPACGSGVEIPETSQNVVCAYCGSRFRVEPDTAGPVVRPPVPLVQAAPATPGSMERAASEMAIARIQGEINELVKKRYPHAAEWNALVRAREKKWNFKWILILSLCSLLGLFIVFIIAAIADWDTIGVISFLLFFADLIFLVVLGVRYLQSKISAKRLEKMAIFMVPLNQRIHELEQEIERHKRIVSLK